MAEGGLGLGDLDIIVYLVFGHLLGHCYDSLGNSCGGHPSESYFQESW